jgi:hypothetical protein
VAQDELDRMVLHCTLGKPYTPSTPEAAAVLADIKRAVAAIKAPWLDRGATVRLAGHSDRVKIRAQLTTVRTTCLIAAGR